jgi:spermidine dehydrogenase
MGSGAALLGMASPASIKTAAAQSAAKMTGLGPEWTGPGGIGDYARSNGNTHEVVNAAHGGIRNQQWDALLRAAKDTGESPDVIVVGCGMAGLSACWAARKGAPTATVLMLDQHPIFGGEAKQNEFEVDGYHLTAPWAPPASSCRSTRPKMPACGPILPTTSDSRRSLSIKSRRA